jgi:hypothetical protein
LAGSARSRPRRVRFDDVLAEALDVLTLAFVSLSLSLFSGADSVEGSVSASSVAASSGAAEAGSDQLATPTSVDAKASRTAHALIVAEYTDPIRDDLDAS